MVSLYHLSMLAGCLGFELDLAAIQPLRRLLRRESRLAVRDEHARRGEGPEPVSGDRTDQSVGVLAHQNATRSEADALVHDMGDHGTTVKQDAPLHDVIE